MKICVIISLIFISTILSLCKLRFFDIEVKNTQPGKNQKDLLNNHAVQCIKDICPDAASFDSREEIATQRIADIIKNRPSEVDAFNKSIVTELMRPFMDVIDQYQIKWLQELKRLLKEAKPVDPQYQPLHNLLEMDNYYYHTVFLKNTYQLDISRTKKNLGVLPDSKKNWIISILKSYYQEDIAREVLIIFDSYVSPSQFYEILYPDLPYQQAIYIDFSKVVEALQLIGGPSGRLLHNLSSIRYLLFNPLLLKVMTQEEMTETEVKSYLRIRIELLRYKTFLLTNSKNRTFYQTNPETFYEYTKRIKLEEKIAKFLDFLSNKDQVIRKREEVIKRCRQNYFYNLAHLPSSKEIDNFNPHIVWAKKQIKQYITPLFSLKTQDYLRKIVDDAEFNLPEFNETLLERFKKDLTEEIRILVSSLDHYLTTIGQESNQQMTLASAKIDYYLDKDNYYFEISDLCEQYLIEGNTDNAVSTTGNINVSGFSVLYPQYGKFTLLHELGHQLSFALRSKKVSTLSQTSFYKIRQCLLGKHPEKPWEGFVEEDFADLIEFKANHNKMGNNFCVELPQSKNSFDSPQVFQLDPPYSHSSNFFRVIHQHFISNQQLPSSCKEAIKLAGWNYSFYVDCLKFIQK